MLGSGLQWYRGLNAFSSVSGTDREICRGTNTAIGSTDTHCMPALWWSVPLFRRGQRAKLPFHSVLMTLLRDRLAGALFRNAKRRLDLWQGEPLIPTDYNMCIRQKRGAMLRYIEFTPFLQSPYLYTLFHCSLRTGECARIFSPVKCWLA